MTLNRQTSGNRWRIRPDGKEKVSGRLVYLTDMSAEHMLFGRVLRSPLPHAWIVSVRTDKAERLPGVRAVLTSKAVPGLNRFGIAFPHQPVFCEDRVRYVGDAIAAVAADSGDIAEHALSLIEVDFEPLPVIDDPEKALEDDSPRLYAEGNVLHRTEYRKGNTAEAFARCARIVEETYWTPRQMHTYMETEGGLFVPEENGRLTVYSATQHGLMDRMQLSRILDVPESDIRVISSPIGGSFGGKDELNVQPYGALLALRTGRPVKMHNSRAESVRGGLKRHPMKITMKTGTDEEGRLIAHQVRIVSDTGAYATLGAQVLNFCTEHVTGPYRFENVDVEGVAVYTNNGVSGEFRGFGGNQAIFALEGQMDRLAEAYGMDPWEFRALNLRRYGDPGPLGQRIAQTDGAKQVWEAIEQCALRAESKEENAPSKLEPWIRTGVGAALAMHGAGLGFGIPDPGAGRLSLASDGKIEAVFGYEEFGQGLLATLEQMLIEQFGFAADDLRIVIGDTDAVPDSGSSTASRATTMMWTALSRLKPDFTRRLLETASSVTGKPAGSLTVGPGGISENGGGIVLSYAELAGAIGQPIVCETKFHYPLTPDERVGAHFLYTYAAVAVKVEVNTLTGRVRVLDQFHTVAAGPVVNPQGYLGQIEGGSGMALGFTLMEDALMDGGRYLTNNLDTYLIPTIADMNGEIRVEPIEELPEHDVYGPRGVGEIGSVSLAPAIASAIYQAVGKRVVKLPIEPELLLEAPFIVAEGGGRNAE
ncbi:xanthine dehydrogenase subunit D [Paenibacillus alkalitolerans]|uniref:xanthine dehydrogenase subunit D n=1 Tax=Paenibacillus alkalitolerans TaxID=2799335 RepID=UPI0018F36509|nr:xanthine dehydrogenase subunit D [Paenibacillus alkalitolerans]